MIISKTYLQNSSEVLEAIEQKYDVIPQGTGLQAPLTSLNKLCYLQMREITKRRAADNGDKHLQQALRAYRDYAVKHI